MSKSNFNQWDELLEKFLASEEIEKISNISSKLFLQILTSNNTILYFYRRFLFGLKFGFHTTDFVAVAHSACTELSKYRCTREFWFGSAAFCSLEKVELVLLSRLILLLSCEDRLQQPIILRYFMQLSAILKRMLLFLFLCGWARTT